MFSVIEININIRWKNKKFEMMPTEVLKCLTKTEIK